jgi:hypothetical protein
MSRDLIVYEKMETVCVQVGKQMVETIREKLIEDKDATLSDEQIKEISAPILDTFKAELRTRSAKEAEELLEKEKDRAKKADLDYRAALLKRNWSEKVIVDLNDFEFSLEEQACKRVKKYLESSAPNIPSLESSTIKWEEPRRELDELQDDPAIWTYSSFNPQSKYCPKVVAKVDDKLSKVLFGNYLDIAKAVIKSGVVDSEAFQLRYKELMNLSQHSDEQIEDMLKMLSLADSAFKGKGINLSFFVEFVRSWSDLSPAQATALLEIYQSIGLFEKGSEDEEDEDEEDEDEDDDEEDGEGDDEVEAGDEAEQELCTANEIGECACKKCAGSDSAEE